MGELPVSRFSNFKETTGKEEGHPLHHVANSDLVEVMLASEGYGWKPDDQVKKGVEIFGVEEAGRMIDVMVFQGGTAMVDGKLVTSGGRVMTVTALGDSVEDARRKAHEAIGKIRFEGMQWRRDIGKGK